MHDRVRQHAAGARVPVDDVACGRDLRVGEHVGRGGPGVDVSNAIAVSLVPNVAASAGANLTPVSLELGGKAPFLIFADADLEAAVEAGRQPVRQRGAGVPRGHAAAGRAGDPRRVPRPVHRGGRGDPAGRPARGDTEIGPQITREHFDRVDGFVQRAKAEGVKAVFGGGPNEDLGGLYYRPTLFREPRPTPRSSSTRCSAPSSRSSGSPEEEGVALANDTKYGLSAIVYTGDRERAERVSSALVAGTVWVNSFFVRDLRAPFGGSRNSGIGREGGFWSFDFYSDVKNVCMAPWT